MPLWWKSSRCFKIVSWETNLRNVLRWSWLGSHGLRIKKPKFSLSILRYQGSTAKNLHCDMCEDMQEALSQWHPWMSPWLSVCTMAIRRVLGQETSRWRSLSMTVSELQILIVTQIMSWLPFCLGVAIWANCSKAEKSDGFRGVEQLRAGRGEHR